MELRLPAFPSKEWTGVVVDVVVVSVVVLSLYALGTAADTVCPPISGKPSCVCRSKKGVIDLTPLGQKDKPRFNNIHSLNDPTADYWFNPCYKLTTTGCPSAYVCNEQSGLPVSVGDSNEKIYIDSDGTPYLHYDTLFSSVKISLKCTHSKDISMVLDRIDTGNEYIFTLSGRQVCPATSAGIAAGIIGIVIIIMFILAIVVYFVAGGIFLRVKNGPGSDIIIHKTFWKEVPFWIKDGAMFTARSAKSLVTRGSKNRDSYESIK